MGHTAPRQGVASSASQRDMRMDPGSDAAPKTAIRTFLIADVRGYTLFTAERGDEAAAKLAARFAEVAREGVEARGGEVIELRGDEALAVFESSRQAIRAAVELQRRFVDETVADPELPLAVGIGLDAGEAVPVEGGYRGGALNLAARLCGLAGPAEILASREVVHLARKVDGVSSVDRGAVHLKGLTDPIHVIRLRAEAEDVAEDLAFRRALGPAASRLVPLVPGAMVPNPYKGLRPFEEGDAPDFFGREALIAQLVERLAETRFLAVIGPSGSGKSSVVRAGLIPAIRRGALPGSNEWRIAEILPGAHPLYELEAGLLRVAVNPPSTLIEQLERDDHGLLRAVKRVLPADGSELVLVIDQFEEVFTLVEGESKRTHFLESLEAAVTDPHSRLRVVITLRADFYDRPLLYRGFAELLSSRVEAVVPLSPEELERAISGPARRVDVRLEHGLVAEMLAEVADEPGALPLLQYALTELFERREDSVLSLEAYRAIGGVSGALGRRAEELYAEHDAVGKEAARQLLLRLVSLGEGTEDTRRPVPRSEVVSLDVDRQAMTAVIDAFGASRLLSFDRDSRTGAPTVELAHEALLTAWGRLRRWIDDARDDLRTERRLASAAREWVDEDRDSSFLAGGSRLEQFESWRDTSDISLTPEEREYLDASVGERDRRLAEEEAREARERMLERRSLRRLRALVAVLTATAVIAAALTVFAFNQQGRAEREALRAGREGRVAVARGLAAAAVANLDEDPERSILLALEAVNATRSEDGIVLPEAEEALHRAVVASRIVLSVPDVGGLLDWSPDGERFVTEGPEETGLVDIRDAETGESLLSFHGHDVDVNGVAFSADGSMLATTGDDGALKVWDPKTGDPLADLRGPVSAVEGPSFSPDGSLVAAAWFVNGEVRVFDVATGRLVHLLRQPGPITTSFSSDGKRLGIANLERPEAVVIDVGTWNEVFTLRGQEFQVMDVDWSPNGRWIATSARDETVRIWDGRTGRPRFTLFGHAAAVSSADWSPDSSRLVTGSDDGTAKVWEISEAGGRELLSLSAQDTRAGVNGVAFSPDGDRVMTGDIEIRAVNVWDVSDTGDAEWANLFADPLTFTSVAFTLDGRLVTSGPERLPEEVAIWDPETGRRLGEIAHPERFDEPADELDMEVSPDGGLLAVAGGPRTQVWDLENGDLAFAIRSEGWLESVSWSPDGELLATAGFGEFRARVVDRSGTPVTVLQEESGPDAGKEVVSARFSPDGHLVATVLYPEGRPNPSAHRVKIWDWERERVLKTIATDGGVDDVAFDPRGGRIAVAGQGGVELWDVDSGRKMTELAGGTGGLLDVAFSPDGSLISGSAMDATVRVWDADSGVQLLQLRGHKDVAWDVEFSADGSKLASADVSGIVRVWALALDDLIEIAESEVTRRLTEEECRQYLPVDRATEMEPAACA
jgi:WD40 repeat protein/class 3 adenylate cyclase